MACESANAAQHRRGAAPGYLSRIYAESLCEFGTPTELPQSGGWVLVRSIPNSAYKDAMGCYPLFSCEQWGNLNLDLAGLDSHLVSVSLVAEPFGAYRPRELEEIFDFAVPFKEHYITDLREGAASKLSPNHRRRVRQALRTVDVECCEPGDELLDEWVRFYSHLQAKHRFSGIQAFSRASFAVLLTVPGLVIFRARCQGESIGIHFWFIQGDVAYYHLGATSEEGYRRGASYALFWSAREELRGKVNWLDLGGVAGTTENKSSGLRQFKSGWATGSKPAYFCGKVLNRKYYESLVRDRGLKEANYFPIYRAGEFAADVRSTAAEAQQ